MPPIAVRPADKNQKVLVYLFGSLGDSIVAIPALRAVRRHFPDAEVVVLQNFESGDLVVASEVLPTSLVDRHLTYKTGVGGISKATSYFRLFSALRSERFDAVVYLVMSERPARSVARDRFFFRLCGIMNTLGFHAISPKDLWPVDPDGHPGLTAHEAVFRLRRLRLDGIGSCSEDLETPLMEFDEATTSLVKTWLSENRKRPDLPLFSVAPGCKSQANSWSLENFLELGKRMLSQFDCEIVITGGKAEYELGQKLLTAWGHGLNAAGRFSVIQSAALLAQCDLHIGLDTGTMHLAAASGTRCFIAFGERSNPGLWFPLGSGHTIVFHKAACAGCHSQECPVVGHPCMNGIKADAVWQHLTTTLTDNAEPTSPIKVIPV